MTEAPPVEVRLVNGARLLGTLWKRNVRCAAGWSVDCACAPKTKFCAAKLHWIALAVREARKIDSDSPFAVVGAMTWDEFKASGLTMRKRIVDGREVRVGPAAGAIPVDRFRSLTEEGGLASVVTVLAHFPGAKVVG